MEKRLTEEKALFEQNIKDLTQKINEFEDAIIQFKDMKSQNQGALQLIKTLLLDIKQENSKKLKAVESGK